MDAYEDFQQDEPEGFLSWKEEKDEDDIVPSITLNHSEPLLFKRCMFQGHAAPVTSETDVRRILENLQQTEPWSEANVLPFAYRLQGGDGEETDSEEILTMDHSVQSEQGKEGWGDEGDVGAGEKLLYLLQRWDVQNVLVAVTRIDNGFMASTLLGIRRYRVLLDRAKVVLEKCYLSSLTPGPEEQEEETVSSLFPEAESQDISELVSKGPAPPPPRMISAEGSNATQKSMDESGVNLFPDPPSTAQESPRALPPGKIRTAAENAKYSSAQTRGEPGGLSIKGNVQSSGSSNITEGGIYRPSFATSIKITPRRRGGTTSAQRRGSDSKSLRSIKTFTQAKTGDGWSLRMPPKQPAQKTALNKVAVGFDLPEGHVPDPLGGKRRKKRGQVNNFKYDREMKEKEAMQLMASPEELLGQYEEEAARTWSAGNSATWFRAEVANTRIAAMAAQSEYRKKTPTRSSMMAPPAVPQGETALLPTPVVDGINAREEEGPIAEEEVYRKLMNFTGGISPMNSTARHSARHDSMGFLRPWSEVPPQSGRSETDDPLAALLGELGKDERPEVRVRAPLLSRQERNELKSLLHPVESIWTVLRGIRCLTHGSNASKAGWMECKRMACNKDAVAALGQVNISEVPPDRVDQARQQLALVPLNYEQMEHSNSAGARFYKWLAEAIESFDKVHNDRKVPKTADLEMLANSS